LLQGRDLEIETTLSKKNPIYHIEKHAWIKDASGVVRPLGELKVAQKKLLALYYWAKSNNQPVRIIILKARKEGLSTALQILMYYEVLARGIDAVVIAHDDGSTRKIFEIAERVHTRYQLEKPELRRSNVKEIKFRDREGSMSVLTAGNKYSGSGLTPQFLHCSEASKWRHGAETATSLMQSVADLPETAVVIECTACGFDSLYKPMWDAAADNCSIRWEINDDVGVKPIITVENREHWNGYLPLFIPWYEDQQYQKEFSYEGESKWFQESMDRVEEENMNKFGLSLEQMNAYRYLLKNKCQNDKKKRSQEYPYTPDEAFIHSGRPRFNVDIITSMPTVDPQRGTILPAARMSRRLQFHPDSGGDVYMWARPVPGHQYVCGVDTCEGKIPDGRSDPDGSVCQMFDYTAGGVQVAKIYGQISEELLVDPLLLFLEYYNGAYAVIESNSTGKHVAIEVANKYPDSRLYHRDDWDQKGRKLREVGHRTHHGNRSRAIGRLATYMESRSIVIKDEKTCHELVGFHITSGGRAEATIGYHDDHVSALMLVCIGIDVYPQNLKAYSPYTKTENIPRSFRYSKQRGSGKTTPIY